MAKPGAKGTLAAKFVQLTPSLNECVLRAVFRFRDIAGHAQTKPVNLADMHPVQRLESSRITGLSLADPSIFL